MTGRSRPGGFARRAALLVLWIGPLGCGAPAGDDRTPLAVVGDETLYRDEVAGAVAFRVYRHEVDIYSLLRGETERRIDESLLEREAARRGTSVEELVAQVEGEVAPVSESEVDRYLAEHPGDSPGAEEGDVRARVRHYLGERGRIERRLALMESLREAAGVRILLEPPTAPRTDVDVEGAPARGPEDAPLTLVHFATFSSRASARSAARIAEIVQEHPDQMRWVHRSFLNDRDEMGLLAARVAVAASDAGVFWELHDRLFARGGFLDPESIIEDALEVGLSEEAIEAARREPEVLRRVKRDMEAANTSGAIREPTLFLNGRYASGLDAGSIRTAVREELSLTERR